MKSKGSVDVRLSRTSYKTRTFTLTGAGRSLLEKTHRVPCRGWTRVDSVPSLMSPSLPRRRWGCDGDEGPPTGRRTSSTPPIRGPKGCRPTCRTLSFTLNQPESVSPERPILFRKYRSINLCLLTNPGKNQDTRRCPSEPFPTEGSGVSRTMVGKGAEDLVLVAGSGHRKNR